MHMARPHSLMLPIPIAEEVIYQLAFLEAEKMYGIQYLAEGEVTESRQDLQMALEIYVTFVCLLSLRAILCKQEAVLISHMCPSQHPQSTRHHTLAQQHFLDRSARQRLPDTLGNFLSVCWVGRNG